MAWRLALGLAMGAACLAGVAATPPTQRWSTLADISFQHLTQDQGLPNAIATAVAEDGQGFLWVGTLGGLARWDGYHFKVYKGDAQTAGALPDNYIQSLHGDAQGRLWVGTSAAGLLRHDPVADCFVRIPVGGGDGISHVSVRQIVDDGSGGLWIVTDGGLDHLDPQSGRIDHASTAGAWGEAAGPRVWAVLRDRRGRLWVASGAGLFRRAAEGGPLQPVPLAAGRSVQPQSLAQDSAGRIWAGSLHEGVFVLDDEGNAPPVEIHETGITNKADALGNSQITSLLEVQPGEMWVATLGQGLVSVDFEHRDSRRIRHVPAWPVSLSDNALRTLYRDRAGQVWAASNRGLSRYDPRQGGVLTRLGVSPENEDVLDSRFISAEISWILPMPDGRIWLATHKSGIDILDASGARAAALRPDARRPESALPVDIVLAMARVADGGVFIATKRGLYRADATGRRLSRVTLAGRDPAASTWALLVDGDTLWIGGQFDGLWRMELGSGRTSRVVPAAPGLTDQRIMVLARGTSGELWVGTRNGLNRLEPTTGAVVQYPAGPTQPHGLSAGFVTALMLDGQERLWVGTYGGGIDVLPAPGNAAAETVRIGTGQGLPDGTVNALLQDLQGQVWASTDNGLARIDDRMAVRALRRAEGVVFPTYWTGAAARTERGELLFGGAGGMTVVLPERLQAWNFKPRVLVVDVQVAGQRVTPGAGLLDVPADGNSLAVEFSSSDFSAPERNRYAYQLEGYDASWVAADAARRLAAYTNLPPGDYRLRLRASNRDGQWGEQELVLPVKVRPAWHQTWWFRVALAVSLGLLLVAAIAARTRMLRHRQLELEHKVRERTAELRALHEALEEKSAQLELSSVTDPLTGLHNRRFLSEHIEQDLAVALRRAQEVRAAGGQPLDTDCVFLLLDIDAFKRINDRHGHAAGDEVLVQFGARLRAVMRESDCLVRWGGEEFLAVARDTDRSRAEELAERMRAAVAERPFRLSDGLELDVSCSIGFACVPFELEKPLARSWQQVVNLADLGLYAAKRSGRNAWVGVHTTLGRAAGGQRVVGGFGLSSNRNLDDVAAALNTSTEPSAC